MKYFVFEVSEGDSKIAGKSAAEFSAEKDAIQSFHQRLATAMKSELYTSDLVMVIDENGVVIKREKYAVPAEVVETGTEE